jgi:predicted dehydrogenase
MRKVKTGIIGCGVISQTYLVNLTTYYTTVEVVALADIFIDKAREAAQKFNIPRACSVAELLADPAIEIVINLTIPAAHAEINLAALHAGKHVYCEKPLATNLADARQTLDLACSKGLMLGCSPDTFLGPGLQTCRKILDEGWIGEPVAATANLVSHGHETWHPAPEFYYKTGAGPMMDMGSYYLTALVSMLGPISKVSCFAKKSLQTRRITSQPLNGQKISVDVMTHYAGLMEFANGVIANINMSFDVWLANLPCIEIYGTEGTLVVPDPNMFSGPVKILRGESMVDSIRGLSVDDACDKIHSPDMFEFFQEIPLPYHLASVNMRGLGVLDMACALVEGRPHRTSGDLTYHVTEAMLSFDRSAQDGMTWQMESSCERPQPVSPGLAIGEI